MKPHMGVLVLALAVCSAGSAGVITFNDGASGVLVGNFYAGLGVTFSGASFDSFGCQGACGPNSGLAIASLGTNYQPKVDSPIVITFAQPMTFVSIYGLNVGANGARMDAYDSPVGGALLGFAQDTSVPVGVGADNNPLLQLSTTGIWRVQLYQPLSVEPEGLLFDTLSFSEIPEPSTWLLCGAGLAALLYRRRRA